MRSILVLFAVLAASAASAEPVIPGYVNVMIRPGTNTVSNLPFTDRMRPSLDGFREAQPGDTFVWKGETHVFDGKAWSGPKGGDALVPTHESFTVIRTANVTNVWAVGGDVDMRKAPRK